LKAPEKEAIQETQDFVWVQVKLIKYKSRLFNLLFTFIRQQKKSVLTERKPMITFLQITLFYNYNNIIPVVLCILTSLCQKLFT